MMMGPQIERQARLDNVSIIDLAPTILYAMGVPIPQDMDGRPLVEVFVEDAAQGIPLMSMVPTYSAQRSEEASYTAEESREIEGRLRRMGYLG
jgi:arylsulfatase A-like enzyme